MNARDVVEIIAELFSLYNFTIEFWGGGCEYNQHSRTVFVTNVQGVNTFQAMGLAHEIMHHKQNTEGRIPHDGMGLLDYKYAQLLMNADKRNEWRVREFPFEMEAIAFSLLFADRMLKLLDDCDMLSEDINYFKREARSILKIKKPDPSHVERVKAIQNEEARLYKYFEKEYADKLDELIKRRVMNRGPNKIEISSAKVKAKRA